MTRTIEYLQNRIHKLTEKDFMMNKNIINKLQRQIRALEKKNESA
jgi:prefoldin subunit 5